MSDRTVLREEAERVEVLSPEVVNAEGMSEALPREKQGELREDREIAEVLSPEVVNAAEASAAPPQQKQGGLKGMLMMAICCGAPLLLLLAIPFLGAAFGSLAAVGTGLLTVVAVLACPVGMYLMMRMMMNNKK